MKYKLINPPSNKYNAQQQILINRGIDEKDISHYMNLTDDDINPPEALGEELLEKAAAALRATLDQPDKEIAVIVDCDCDGYTSSAVLINYLHDLAPAYAENHVHWYHHEGKQHGLQDSIEWIEDIGADLIIVPDAGSNDWDQLQRLHEQGRDVIILDHHEIEGEAYPNCILINSQLPQYPNKDLSGVGVVYQFCRYLDKIYNVSYADNYLDLVALGLDGDMMSLRSLETRRLISKGLEPNRIINPFIYGMWQKNNFKLGDTPTAWGFTFYVVPFVNAITRSGTLEEKELIFNSMLKFKAFQQIPSNKRGHKIGETERLVNQAVRTCTNVKNRQGRAEDAGLELVEHLIKDNNMMEHKVLLFLLEPGQIQPEIRGLIANKLMAKYQRPCCMLTKTQDWEVDEKTFKKTLIKTSYQGSARGCDMVGVTEFKDICAATQSCDYVAGHQGAFGLGLPAENIDKFIASTDEQLKDMSSEPLYYVDYIWNPTEFFGQDILDIAKMASYWGKDVSEPLVAVQGVEVTKDNIQLMKSNTVKITLPNGVNMIKFNMPEEDYNQLYSSTGEVTINVVGRCNVNYWNNYEYPQILIDDFEIVKKVAYVF